MSTAKQGRKRKAVTRDSPDTEEAAIFDELGNGPFNGASFSSEDEQLHSGSDDESELDNGEESSNNDESEKEELDSDEIPPAEDSDLLYHANESSLKLSTSKPHNEVSNSKHLTVNGAIRVVHRYTPPEIEPVEEDDAESAQDYTIERDANGNLRYVYRDIDPVYDSDDSDAPANANTIGDIPLTFYDSYPHIGYDINGQKIMRPAKGAALDSLLDSIEIPKGWTGLTDPATGKPLELNKEELDMLKRLTRNEFPEDGYDPYPDMVEYFTNRVEAMPLSAAPEPKRRFVPSKHEAKRIMKIVKAIKEGRIQPYKPPAEEEEDQDLKRYDIWANEAPRPDHIMNIPAPKLPPPGYEESYRPPPEYLPDDEELKAWQDADDEDRDKEVLPSTHEALRKVPGYARFLKERFERCLDLYLAPRLRRNKLDIDPESLLPKLPSPEALRPFPTRTDVVFRGHRGRVRSLAIDARGIYLATGGDDGSIRVWTLTDGRQTWSVKLSDQDAVNVVRWRPGKEACVLAAAAGENIFLVAPDLVLDVETRSNSASVNRDLLNAGWSVARAASTSNGDTAKSKDASANWIRPEPRLQEQGVLVQITVRSTVKVISWHRRGEYFATVSPQGQSTAIAIHTLSKHLTQLPFRHLKGLAQFVQFHPAKPIFFVATQRTIRTYDLAKQELLKILQPGARWISSFDVHPGGDNLIVGSYDKRLLWLDLDLSTRPYKTLRYHQKAIRSVRFHPGGYPLFADASDDGSLQVFHGKVVGDLMENANIVPLKVLKGHTVTNGLGVLDVDWHPTEPWCVSAGADGTCRLWRP